MTYVEEYNYWINNLKFSKSKLNKDLYVRHCMSVYGTQVIKFSKDQYGNSLHRLDGPARIYSDGTVEFWIDAVYYDYKKFLLNPKVLESKLNQIISL